MRTVAPLLGALVLTLAPPRALMMISAALNLLIEI
jgi:hypothetical protein